MRLGGEKKPQPANPATSSNPAPKKPVPGRPDKPLEIEPAAQPASMVSPTRISKPSADDLVPIEGDEIEEIEEIPLHNTLISDPDNNDVIGSEFDDIESLISAAPNTPASPPSAKPVSAPKQPPKKPQPPAKIPQPKQDAKQPAKPPVQKQDTAANRPAVPKQKPAPVPSPLNDSSASSGIAILDSDEEINLGSGDLPEAMLVSDDPEVAELIKTPAGDAKPKNDVVVSEDESSAADHSFDVLEDSDSDVMELSPGDMVVEPNTARFQQSPGADFGQMPPTPATPVAQPVVAKYSPAPTATAGTHPQSVPAEATPTSMNPAYQAFGPPPPAHYPDEPAVPDGHSPEFSQAAGSGFATNPGQRGGVSNEALIALVVSFLAAILGLWMAYESFKVVHWLTRSTPPVDSLAGQGRFLAFMYGFQLLAALGMMIGAALFFVNELMRLNGSDLMPYSCIIALVGGCVFIFVRLSLGASLIFTRTAASAYGIMPGATLFKILLSTVFLCLIPIAMVVFAAMRQK